MDFVYFIFFDKHIKYYSKKYSNIPYICYTSFNSIKLIAFGCFFYEIKY